MDQRTIEHFEERLDKDSYSKEDVAKLLHNEAGFTAQQTKKDFDGFVSREDYDAVNTELSGVKAELTPYKDADFNTLAGGEFNKLNGAEGRLDDFKTLAGLKGTESSEDILAKATEMKESGKYDFMFTKEDSGAATQRVNLVDSPKVPKKGAFTPSMGGYNLFKRKK